MHRDDAADEYAPEISVVIATRGRSRELQECLEALEKQSFYDFEIVVVDSAPADGDETNREIAKKFNAKYVCVTRIGSSRARNQGAKEASGKIIALTDDDAQPEPEWLVRIHEEMKDESVAAVVGKTAAIASDSQASKDFERAGGFVNGGSERSVITKETPGWFPLVAFHGLGMLANMAVRRSFFLRKSSEGWSGFDERLGRGSVIHGYDENLALFSLVHEGNKIVYSPDIVVRHPGPNSVDELKNEMRMNRSASAAFFLLLKWEYPSCWGKLTRHLWGKLFSSSSSSEQFPEISFSLWERIVDRARGVGWYLKSVFDL